MQNDNASRKFVRKYEKICVGILLFEEDRMDGDNALDR